MNGAVDFSYEFGQIEENERLKAQLRMAQRKITSFQSGNNRLVADLTTELQAKEKEQVSRPWTLHDISKKLQSEKTTLEKPEYFKMLGIVKVPERSVFSTMVDRDKINQQSSIEKKRSRRRNVQSLYNSSLQSGSSSREKQLELKRRRVEWSKLSEKQPSEFRSPKQLLSQVQTEPVMPKQRRPSLLRYFTTPKEATKSPENGEIKESTPPPSTTTTPSPPKKAGQKRSLSAEPKEKTKAQIPSRLPVISQRRGSSRDNIKRAKVVEVEKSSKNDEKDLKAEAPQNNTTKKSKRRRRMRFTPRRRRQVEKVVDQNNANSVPDLLKNEPIQSINSEVQSEKVMIDVAPPVVPLFPDISRNIETAQADSVENDQNKFELMKSSREVEKGIIDVSPPALPLVASIESDTPKLAPEVESPTPVTTQSANFTPPKVISQRLAQKPRRRWNKDEVCAESQSRKSIKDKSTTKEIQKEVERVVKQPRRKSEPRELSHLFELQRSTPGVKFHEIYTGTMTKVRDTKRYKCYWCGNDFASRQVVRFHTERSHREKLLAKRAELQANNSNIFKIHA